MSILDMSITGGVLILVIVVLRAVLINGLPKGTFLVLWCVALLRLLVPFAVPAATSVYAWAAPSPAATVQAETVPMQTVQTTAPAAYQPQAADMAETASVTADGVSQRQSVVIPWRTVIWAAGAVLCGGWFAAAWLRGRRKFENAVPAEDEYIALWLGNHPARRRISVRITAVVETPMTYGIWRPVILLPAGMDREDRERLGFILAHEYVHIQRLDGAVKLALILAVCLHWFNPLVWVMYILMNRDMELACDERVVCSLPDDARAAYARTLIDMEEVRSGLAPLASHFSKNAMEERITAIMKIKKLTALAAMISLMLVLGVTTVFATTAPSSESEDSESARILYLWDISNGTVTPQDPDGENIYELGVILPGETEPVSIHAETLDSGAYCGDSMAPGSEAAFSWNDAQTIYALLVVVEDGQIELGLRNGNSLVQAESFTMTAGDLLTTSMDIPTDGSYTVFIRNTGETEADICVYLVGERR